MKKIILIPLVMCLLSCSNNKVINIEEVKHTYEEVNHLLMEWQDLLTKENNYYCYIYSIYCTHCENIKDIVINKALQIDNLYFVKYQKDIPIFKDVSNTIGAKDIESVGILGTPSLIGVDNHEVILNVAGEKKVLEILEKL